MKPAQRKRRTREHIIADLAVNHVERQALLCGFVAERNQHDYGIDMNITTFNEDGEIEPEKIMIQVKASDKINVRSGGAISCRIERKHLTTWLAQPMPVILIFYDAAVNVAYWLYVQSYFREYGLKLFTTVTLPIPTANIVNPDAMMMFARFRDRVLEQIGEVYHDEVERQNDSI